MNFGVAESPYHRHSLRSQGDEGVKLKNIPMEHGSMGMAIQNKIDITHLNAIDPIKRHIVITIFVSVFMRLVLCASNFLHGSKLAA